MPTTRIPLPLEGLLDYLSTAGFQISPADRLRILRALEGETAFDPSQPDRLKYLLGPLVARSSAQQEQFYKLFKQYWNECGSREVNPTGQKNRRSQVATPMAWIAITLLAGGLIFLLSKISNRPTTPDLFINFQHPPEVVYGDSLRLDNLSVLDDSSRYHFIWRLFNDAGEEYVDSLHYHGRIPTAGLNDPKADWQVILEVWDLNKQNLYEAGPKAVRLICSDLPEVSNWAVPSSGQPGEQLNFSVSADTSFRLQYLWDFGDGSAPVAGPQQTYSYLQTGQYRGMLTVSDTLQTAHCIIQLPFEIFISNDPNLVLLPTYPLQRDEVTPTARFQTWVGVIVGCLNILPLFLFLLWRSNSSKKKEEATHGSGTSALEALRFRPTNRPPFFIPFRSQEQHISVANNRYLLANALRRRREGGQMSLDIAASLNATIERGGFPGICFRKDHHASEYLFLIDRQSFGSHQAALFQYLLAELKQREIYLELFYYETQPTRVWNNDHPGGLLLEQLSGRYPDHRLIVLGDAHAMLNKRSVNSLGLQPETGAALRSWKQRILITPFPPISWSYREAALSQVFAIFPADNLGLDQAAHFVTADLNLEDLPSAFVQWRQHHLANRSEIDTNYRDWEDPEELEEYFADRPELMEWLCALAVYPHLNWNLSLAIGRALEPRGVVVSFDHLLYLSRVEWLQGGRLNSRLRNQLLDRLAPEAKRLARLAVKTELEAVRAAVAGSHAAVELETNLAIQSFALDPEGQDNQQLLKLLSDHRQLSPEQMDELNRILAERQPESDSRKIDEFLNQAAGRQRTAQWRRRIWLLVISVLFFLNLAGLFWLSNGSDRLYRLTFGDAPEAFLERELRQHWLVKETISSDSATWYNNKAVEAFDSVRVRWDRNLQLNGSTIYVPVTDTAWSVPFEYLRAALDYRPNYNLAAENLKKLHFNRPAHAFNTVLTSQTRRDSLLSLKASFRSLFQDTVHQSSATEAIGLIHQYNNQMDSTLAYYRILAQAGYFDTLKYSPNLQTRLGIRRHQLREIQITETSEELILQVTFYYDRMSDHQLGMALYFLSRDGMANALYQEVQLIEKNSFNERSFALPWEALDGILPGADSLSVILGNQTKDWSLDTLTIPLVLKRQALIPFQRNDLWGFQNIRGQEVVSPQFDEVGEFTEDRIAWVGQNGLYGYIRPDGSLITPIIYERAGHFREGMAYVQQQGRRGYIDTRGEVVIPLRFDDAQSFHNGRASISWDGREFTINKQGQCVDGDCPMVLLKGRVTARAQPGGSSMIGLEEVSIEVHGFKVAQSGEAGRYAWLLAKNVGFEFESLPSVARAGRFFESEGNLFLSIFPRLQVLMDRFGTYGVTSSEEEELIYYYIIASSIWNSEGREDLENGAITITFEKPGYRTLDTVLTSIRENRQLTVQLEPGNPEELKMEVPSLSTVESALPTVKRQDEVNLLPFLPVPVVYERVPITGSTRTGLLNWVKALDLFEQAEKSEQIYRLNSLPIPNQAPGPDNTVAQRSPMELYREADQYINQALRSPNTIKKEGKWGNVLTLKALISWRLGMADQAVEFAVSAQSAFNEFRFESFRDQIMAAAIPALVSIDMVYDSLTPATESLKRISDDKTMQNAVAIDSILNQTWTLYDRWIRDNGHARSLANADILLRKILSQSIDNPELLVYLQSALLAGLKNRYDLLAQIDNFVKRSALGTTDNNWRARIDNEMSDYLRDKDRALKELALLLEGGTGNSVYQFWDNLL